ncbi:hypothetical protein KR222_004927, partial [Zaprionus bogoriensis]
AKHWRRAPVRGTFDVDAYAYNKPVGRLLADQQAAPALPMTQLLEQLSESSRSEQVKSQPQYRQLDGKGIEAIAEQPQAGASASDSVLSKRLALLAAETSLYSHEFHVQTKGNKKFVQLNTLSGSSRRGASPAEASDDVVSETQTQPLNVKLALPALQEQLEEEEEQEQPEKVEQVQQLMEAEQPEQTMGQLQMNANASTSEPEYSQAISTMQQMQAKLTTASDKPLSSLPKSKRKQTKRQTQAQVKPKPKTKTKMRPANEIDTKPTSASNAERVQGMRGASPSQPNVKAPTKESPEISQQDIRRPAVVQKVKGSGMAMGMGAKRKGTQRRPSEQEIETTTNWWHILPYAEIRKFLNTIYDSITDEDDDERAQRI